MKHLVLLGDSVFDNGVYVSPGPDVIQQLQGKLQPGWQATLLAVDGAVTDDVTSQLNRLPADATHLFVSAGGNDALRQIGLLSEPASSMAAALYRLAEVSSSFERAYKSMLAALTQQQRSITLCTIYNPRFDDPFQQQIAVTALGVFNDVILRAAFQSGLPILDLRLICNQREDYANAIEPSRQGGDKIASRIMQVVSTHDFRSRRCEVFV